MNLSKSIDSFILPRLKDYIIKIDHQNKEFFLDGIYPFKNENIDCFLGGKMVNVASIFLVEAKDSSDYILWKTRFINIIELALTLPLQTWGILDFFKALHRLLKHNIYHKVISQKIQEQIKEKLDWRSFVNIDDLSLFNKTTNYYGVAFAIAKYREIFAMENEEYSKKLLEKFLSHIQQYSSNHLFVDETAGEGRYDYCSILLSAELVEHFHHFQMDIPKIIDKMFDKTIEINLLLANNRGDGFMYGRNLGSYGDNAALLTLSLAAAIGKLSEEQLKITWAYANAIVNKYNNFWVDTELNSLNTWEKGRRTDSHRYKEKLLSENFATAMQIIDAVHYLREVGLAQAEINEKEISDILALPDAFKLFYFYQDNLNNQKAMLIYRHKNFIFQLPIVSGGRDHYDKASYYPIPQMNRVLEASPESNFPFFWPHFITKEKDVASPLNNFKNIIIHEKIKMLEFDVTGFPYIYKYSNNNDSVGEMKILSEVSCHVAYTFNENIIGMKMTISDPNKILTNYQIHFSRFNKNIAINPPHGAVLKDMDVGIYNCSNHGAFTNFAYEGVLSSESFCWKVVFASEANND